MKLIRDFDTLTTKQKKIVMWASVPIGIATSLLFDHGLGIPLNISIRNLLAVILLSLLTGIVIRILRERGIDLWKSEKPKQ